MRRHPHPNPPLIPRDPGRPAREDMTPEEREFYDWQDELEADLQDREHYT